MLCPEELVAFVSALSIAIARGLTISQLDILAAVLTQLADTLAVIAIQRSNIQEAIEKCKELYENNNQNEDNNQNDNNNDENDNDSNAEILL